MKDIVQNEVIYPNAGQLPSSRLETEEDILEQLCLWKNQDIPLDTEELCRHFAIEKRSLSAYLRQLQQHNYIEPVTSGEEIRLTDYGLSVGNNYIYRHNSISQMLQFIGVNEKIADQDACRIEHIVTDESARAICQFINYENMYYERKIRNSDLSDRYEPGTYPFIMQMYSMEQRCPRRLKEEYDQYSRDILLHMTEKGWFELRKTGSIGKKKLWYQDSGRQWILAEQGENEEISERIPANAFTFTVKPNDRVIEGTLLIAFLENDQKKPEVWDCGQLEVEIW